MLPPAPAEADVGGRRAGHTTSVSPLVPMAIKLHQFPPVWGRNVSPFTLKLETWLRLAGLPFEVVPVRNPKKGPKGKLPFIEDEDGTVLGDSTLIIEHLERTRGVDPEAGLDPIQRAEALALQRLFEDHFYFILVYSRWLDPDGWRAVRPAFFRFLPPGVRQTLPWLIRAKVRRDLVAQGIARHRKDDLYAMGRADLEAVSILLDDGPFFFRDRPTTIDAVAYGFLANLLLVPVETGLKRIGLEYANLLAFCQAIERRLGGADHDALATAAQ